MGYSWWSFLGHAMQVKLISAPTLNVRFGGLEKMSISGIPRGNVNQS